VVALLGVRREGVEPEVRRAEPEGGVRVGRSPGRIVADHSVLDPQQLGARARRRLHREDDVCSLIGTEAEERHLELTADMRLVALPRVERNSVDLHGVVPTSRVPRRGEGERAQPETADSAGGGRGNHGQ
jgi:hypothetical protein